MLNWTTQDFGGLFTVTEAQHEGHLYALALVPDGQIELTIDYREIARFSDLDHGKHAAENLAEVFARV